MKSLYLQCCFRKQFQYVDMLLIFQREKRCTLAASFPAGTSSENLNKHNNINNKGRPSER